MQFTRSRAHTTALLTTFAALAACGGRHALAVDMDILGDRPLLHVATFAEAPDLDGAPDEPVWATAEPTGPFFHFQEGVPSRYDTWAKMGIDAKHVYVAFGCREAEVAKLKAERLPPDSMALFANDHVEFFLMPDALSGTFYHFSVDAAGNRHDELGGDGTWDCEWEAAVRLAESTWTVELRIPRKAVGMTDPQMSLANFCRTRRLEPGETSASSKTFGIFHNPARFGRLVYAPPGGADIAAATLRRPRVGENLLEVTLRGGKQGADVTVTGFVGEAASVSRFATEEAHVAAGGEAVIGLPIEVETDARARLVVALSQAGHVVSFCDASEVALSGARPLPIRQVLGPEGAPALQWIDNERLRGISYGIDYSRAMPPDDLTVADTPPPTGAPLRLRGYSIFRIEADESGQIAFDLSALAGTTAFTDSVYALLAKLRLKPTSTSRAAHRGPVAWSVGVAVL